MIAIEFQTTVKNGVIEVPEEYLEQLTDAVRVIILAPEKPAGTGIIARLLADPIRDPNFVPMTRDKIYEGRHESL
jgi:hypothetical protein